MISGVFYLIGGVTRRVLPHPSEVPHLHVNRPLEIILGCRDPFVGGPYKSKKR